MPTIIEGNATNECGLFGYRVIRGVLSCFEFSSQKSFHKNMSGIATALPEVVCITATLSRLE
jgi:hypothetical protein